MILQCWLVNPTDLCRVLCGGWWVVDVRASPARRGILFSFLFLISSRERMQMRGIFVSFFVSYLFSPMDADVNVVVDGGGGGG